MLQTHKTSHSHSVLLLLMALLIAISMACFMPMPYVHAESNQPAASTSAVAADSSNASSQTASNAGSQAGSNSSQNAAGTASSLQNASSNETGNENSNPAGNQQAAGQAAGTASNADSISNESSDSSAASINADADDSTDSSSMRFVYDDDNILSDDIDSKIDEMNQGLRDSCAAKEQQDIPQIFIIVDKHLNNASTRAREAEAQTLVNALTIMDSSIVQNNIIPVVIALYPQAHNNTGDTVKYGVAFGTTEFDDFAAINYAHQHVDVDSVRSNDLSAIAIQVSQDCVSALLGDYPISVSSNRSSSASSSSTDNQQQANNENSNENQSADNRNNNNAIFAIICIGLLILLFGFVYIDS